jgi:hypothetical protein
MSVAALVRYPKGPTRNCTRTLPRPLTRVSQIYTGIEMQDGRVLVVDSIATVANSNRLEKESEFRKTEFPTVLILPDV